MTTGNFTDWSGNMADLGPLYPFVGSEVVMALVLLVAWAAWHIWQVRFETKTYDDYARLLRQGDNLERALQAEHTVERM